MVVVLILAKISIVAAYVSLIWMVIQFRKSDRNVKLEFDLLSRIELSASAGIGLSGLICVIDPSTYTFSFVLCLLSIAIVMFQKYRLILVGDHKILFCAKTHKLKEIKELGTGLLSLRIQTNRVKPYHIYVPLTSNHVLKNRVQAKIKIKKNKKL